MEILKSIALLAAVPLMIFVAYLCAELRRPSRPYDHLACLVGRMGTVRRGPEPVCKAKVLRVTEEECYTTYGRFVRTCRIVTADDGRRARLWQAAYDANLTFTFDAL